MISINARCKVTNVPQLKPAPCADFRSRKRVFRKGIRENLALLPLDNYVSMLYTIGV
jgi:hypothetical protein